MLGRENCQWKKCVMNLKSKSVELFLFMLGQKKYFFQFNIIFVLFSHKVYMKIQEEMVKMLNEESCDDVKLNYLYSSSLALLKHFLLLSKMYVDLLHSYYFFVG